MNIVLFGNDLFSARALEGLSGAGHDVVAVIVEEIKEYRPAGGLLRLAKEKGIPVMFENDPNSSAVQHLLSAWHPDLIVSVHLRKLLRQETYTRAKRGGINVHPSLLPRYRGLSPLEQTILHGDGEGGISIHCIDEAADTGGLILQRRVQLHPRITLFGLQQLLLPLYGQLVPEAVSRIGAPDFRVTKQSEKGSSFFGPVSRENRVIGPGNTVQEIDRHVRAFTKPGPGAIYENRVIWTARFADAEQLNHVKAVNHLAGEEKIFLSGTDGLMISEDFEPIVTHDEQS